MTAGAAASTNRSSRCRKRSPIDRDKGMAMHTRRITKLDLGIDAFVCCRIHAKSDRDDKVPLALGSATGLTSMVDISIRGPGQVRTASHLEGLMYKCTPLVAVVFGSALFGADLPTGEDLFRAIEKSDTGAVRRLLDRGVNANVQDADGTPALMVATLFAGSDCARLLLDRGANPNVANRVGATALMWAIPDTAKVKLLLTHGADVNARSTNLQRTPLLIAASYPGTVEILRLLLDKGADIHAKDRNQIHALGRATLSADVAVVRFLVESGCLT